MNIDVFPRNSTRDTRALQRRRPFSGRTITRTLTNSPLVTAARYSAKRGHVAFTYRMFESNGMLRSSPIMCIGWNFAGAGEKIPSDIERPVEIASRIRGCTYVLSDSTWHTTVYVHVCANAGNICYSVFHNSRSHEDYLCPADMMNETYLPAPLLRQRESSSLVRPWVFGRAFFSSRIRGEESREEKRRRKTNGAFVANPNVNADTSVDR